jgi:CheY-like chemotaxis protein
MAERKKRVLVVDDSEDIQEFFQLVLEAAEYEVETASSGEEAFEKVKASRPDLIVLDLIMPGMDGLEVMTRLRSNLAPPIPPVILCSGFDLTEEAALRGGALMFIRKPVEPSDLRDFVAHGLLGERVSLETAARERAHSASARMRARESAATFVAQIRHEIERRTMNQMSWLAGYFGLETALTTLMENGRLTVFAAAGDPSYTIGLDVSSKLPPCHEILESRSSLVLGDASKHACFSSGPYRLEGVRFFAGVPLLAPEGLPIGVISCWIPMHVGQMRRTC